MMPTTAPPTAPEIDTVPARNPSHAMTALSTTAHGRVLSTSSFELTHTSGEINAISHRTAAAANGTEMLTSSRTGIVSTNPAASAATTGAARENVSGGSGAIDGRVHSASATPAMLPKAMKATVPAIVLSLFHGSGLGKNAEIAETAEFS